MSAEVVIIDSGGANIASLQFALQRLGVSSIVSADAATICAAPRVILPGVGAADDAMARLRQHGLEHVIKALSQPVLGICLGMQLLYDASEEGAAHCLGIIPGRATRLQAGPGQPVPHMGWNTLDLVQATPLLAGIRAGAYVYFVHSYALPVCEGTLASTSYGVPFTACVQRRNFYGAQFHPERSAEVGAKVLHNFLNLH